MLSEDPTTHVGRHARGVKLPSDRFTKFAQQTLTLGEWRRAQALAYPPADVDEGDDA